MRRDAIEISRLLVYIWHAGCTNRSYGWDVSIVDVFRHWEMVCLRVSYLFGVLFYIELPFSIFIPYQSYFVANGAIELV